jgi:hypothetical protein
MLDLKAMLYIYMLKQEALQGETTAMGYKQEAQTGRAVSEELQALFLLLNSAN